MRKTSIHHDFLSSSHCPSCQGEFIAPPTMLTVKSGYELVFKCKQCSVSFALTPVTKFMLCELTND